MKNIIVSIVALGAFLLSVGGTPLQPSSTATTSIAQPAEMSLTISSADALTEEQSCKLQCGITAEKCVRDNYGIPDLVKQCRDTEKKCKSNC